MTSSSHYPLREKSNPRVAVDRATGREYSPSLPDLLSKTEAPVTRRGTIASWPLGDDSLSTTRKTHAASIVEQTGHTIFSS